MTRRSLEFKVPLDPLAIINVASLAAFYPVSINAVYAASKRFLLDFSRARNGDLRRSGVTVMALCPAGLPSLPPSWPISSVGGGRKGASRAPDGRQWPRKGGAGYAIPSPGRRLRIRRRPFEGGGKDAAQELSRRIRLRWYGL